MRITIAWSETRRIAAACGIHPASLSRALTIFDADTGAHVCGAKLALRIEAASAQSERPILRSELRPDLWPPDAETTHSRQAA